MDIATNVAVLRDNADLAAARGDFTLADSFDRLAALMEAGLL